METDKVIYYFAVAFAVFAQAVMEFVAIFLFGGFVMTVLSRTVLENYATQGSGDVLWIGIAVIMFIYYCAIYLTAAGRKEYVKTSWWRRWSVNMKRDIGLKRRLELFGSKK